MRARRYQLTFDRLDARLVLDSGVGAATGGNLASTLTPNVGSNSGSGSTDMIPDPGLGGDGDGSSSGGMIPDPGIG